MTRSVFKSAVAGTLALISPCLVLAAPETETPKTEAVPREDDAGLPKEDLPPLPNKTEIVPKLDSTDVPKIQTVDVPLPPVPVTTSDFRSGKTDIHVSADGLTIQLAGTILEGVSKRLADAIAKNPKAKTVVLTSDGGILIEGAALAHLVRKHGLNTHVEFLCASACTFPLLAGKERSMAPYALVGFHQASTFLGAQTRDEPGNKMMQSAYAGAKLGQEFIDKALATPPHDLWFPDVSMLRANAVITRIAKPEEYPMALGGWTKIGDFVRELEKDAIWAAARTGKPEHYSFSIAAGWMSASNGKSKDSALRSAYTFLIRRLLADAQAYPDDLLLEYAALELTIWDEIGFDSSNRDCDYMPYVRFPVVVPKNEAHRKKQLALYKRMIATPADLPLPDSDARSSAQADVMAFWGRMVAEQGFSAFNVANNFCREPLTYYEEIAKMPEVERIKLLRSMLLMHSAPQRN